MTTEAQYRGRTISVNRGPDGYEWLFDDSRLVTAGMEPCPTRRGAIQAAKAAIREEDGLTGEGDDE
jgi:hypothetical protein